MITNRCLSELTTIWNVDNKLTTKTCIFPEKHVEIQSTLKREYEGIRANMKEYGE